MSTDANTTVKPTIKQEIANLLTHEMTRKELVDVVAESVGAKAGSINAAIRDEINAGRITNGSAAGTLVNVADAAAAAERAEKVKAKQEAPEAPETVEAAEEPAPAKRRAVSVTSVVKALSTRTPRSVADVAESIGEGPDDDSIIEVGMAIQAAVDAGKVIEVDDGFAFLRAPRAGRARVGAGVVIAALNAEPCGDETEVLAVAEALGAWDGAEGPFLTRFRTLARKGRIYRDGGVWKVSVMTRPRKSAADKVIVALTGIGAPAFADELVMIRLSFKDVMAGLAEAKVAGRVIENGDGTWALVDAA